MSLKENIKALKEELNSEEKFFESAVLTERFVKRYRKSIFALVAFLLIGAGSYGGYTVYKDVKNDKANEALNSLLMNNSNKQALKELKENNAELYDIYLLSQSLKEEDASTLKNLAISPVAEVADIAMYENAARSNNMTELESYSKKQDSFYQDLAIIELAVAKMQKGEIEKAQQLLAGVKTDSPVYEMVQNLAHYGVK